MGLRSVERVLNSGSGPKQRSLPASEGASLPEAAAGRAAFARCHRRELLTQGLLGKGPRLHGATAAHYLKQGLDKPKPQLNPWDNAIFSASSPGQSGERHGRAGAVAPSPGTPAGARGSRCPRLASADTCCPRRGTGTGSAPPAAGSGAGPAPKRRQSSQSLTGVRVMPIRNGKGSGNSRISSCFVAGFLVKLATDKSYLKVTLCI